MKHKGFETGVFFSVDIYIQDKLSGIQMGGKNCKIFCRSFKKGLEKGPGEIYKVVRFSDGKHDISSK